MLIFKHVTFLLLIVYYFSISAKFYKLLRKAEVRTSITEVTATNAG
jgi:hypothetical protein